MISKLCLFLVIFGAVFLSHHQTSGHAISIDDVKDKGIEAITAVKLASDKLSAVAAIPLELIKKKAITAAKIPIAIAKKKLAAALVLKKVKLVAPIILFKAAKKAIEAKIAKKKLKLSAMKAALKKHIALAKLLKLAKIPLLLFKLKLPFAGVKKTLKLGSVKKHAVKEALANKLPTNDLGLGALLSGALPLIGSTANINQNLGIPDVLYQFVPDYATQFKNVQIIPKPSSVSINKVTEIYDAPGSSSSSLFGSLPESVPELSADESSVYSVPSNSLALPKL